MQVKTAQLLSLFKRCRDNLQSGLSSSTSRRHCIIKCRSHRYLEKYGKCTSYVHEWQGFAAKYGTLIIHFMSLLVQS